MIMDNSQKADSIIFQDFVFLHFYFNKYSIFRGKIAEYQKI